MPDQVTPDANQASSTQTSANQAGNQTKVLQDLSTVCRDSQEGYRTAASQTTDSELKALFEEFADRRSREADDLDRLIRAQGGEPASRSGSLAGQAHRVFTALRAALTRNDRAAALYEVARGESYAEAAFDRAKRLVLRGEAHDVVMRLHDSVKQSRDKFRRLSEAEGGAPWAFSNAFPAGQRALFCAAPATTEKPMMTGMMALGVGFLVGALTMMMSRPARHRGRHETAHHRRDNYGGSRHEADRPSVGVGG
ncbi:MAG: PA2169 family four-helix-bundle protein [Alphaproteobacteria bacterium]|nr:PA2169 family four-helix-bundle protein [Alphaproteobacteria bacterium]